MNLAVSLPGREIAGFSEALRRELRKQHTRVMRAGASGLRGELRGATSAASLGRLAMTWRHKEFPEGREHISPSAVVWSKAPLPMTAFSEGAVIRSRRGGWLAIPTPAVRGMRGHFAGNIAPKAGGGLEGTGRRGARITPRGFAAATGLHLRFVYTGKRIAYLVASGRTSRAKRAPAGVRRLSARERTRGAAPTVEFVAFWLVPQAVIRKRLDVARLVTATGRRLEADLVSAFDTAAAAAIRNTARG